MRLLVDDVISEFIRSFLPDAILCSRYTAVNTPKNPLPSCSLHSGSVETDEQTKNTVYLMRIRAGEKSREGGAERCVSILHGEAEEGLPETMLSKPGR